MFRQIVLIFILIPALAHSTEFFVKLTSKGVQERGKLLLNTRLEKTRQTVSKTPYEFTIPFSNPEFDRHFPDWLKINVRDENPQKLLDSLNTANIIEYYDPVGSFQVHSLMKDSLIAEQWYLGTIGAIQAWEVTKGADSVIVGVIDTGIDYNHPDLQGSLWLNKKEVDGVAGFDDDGNGYVDDTMGWDFTDAPRFADGGDYRDPDNDPMDEYGTGHGTQIAGIIAAQNGNAIGISGIAPKVKIMNLRAGTASGYLEEDDVANAILYALENGAQIVNMSFGDVALSRFLRDIIYFAYQRGLVMVASAGNSGSDEIHFPSGLPETISVGASSEDDNLAGFSNYGPTIDLVAPGQNILSTAVGGAYSEVSGTSFSAPVVSAVAALIKSLNPGFTVEAIRNILKTSSEDILYYGWDKYSGAGRVSALNAVHVNDGGELKLISPEPGSSTAENFIYLIGTAIHPGLKRVEIDYGSGTDPAAWDRINVFDGRQILSDTLGTIDLSAIENGGIILRLRMVLNSGFADESRNILNIDRTGPVIGNVEIIPMYSGPNAGKLITFETDDICTVRLLFCASGEDQFNIIKELGYETTKHRLLINEDEFNGTYVFKIETINQSGLKTIDDHAGAGFAFSIENDFEWLEFARTGWTIPAGYMLDYTSDFDQDSLREVVVSGYDENQAFGPVRVYEFNNGDFEKRFETGFVAIPRAAGDADSDGRNDLLMGFGQLSFMFESENANAFPSQLIWFDTTNFWAAGYADLDSDGKLEIIGRKDSVYHLLEAGGNNTFNYVGRLLNSTAGQNQYGVPKIELLDLDQDGKDELIFGDYDGDLLAFTGAGNDVFELLAAGKTMHEDATAVFTGINTESGYEFFAATHTSDELNYEHEFDARYWTIERFKYNAEEGKLIATDRINIFGYQSLKDYDSGIKLAKMDNDLYLFCTLYPNLYVFRITEDTIIPVWQADNARSNTVLTEDFDNDGHDEFYYNNGIEIIGFTRGERNRPVRPVGFTASPLDTSRIVLNWKTGVEGQSYKIYKGESSEQLHFFRETTKNGLIDSNLAANRIYYYAVAVVDSGFEIPESFLSVLDSAFPSRPPKLIAAQFENDRQLKLVFSDTIRFDESRRFEAFSKNLQSYASSALVLHDQKSILAGFASAFLNNLPDTLEIKYVFNIHGAPIDRRYDKIIFTYSKEDKEPYLSRYKIVDRSTVQLFFNEPMQPEGLLNIENYEIHPRGMVMHAELAGNDDRGVQLKFSPETMIGALGVDSYLNLQHLYSQKGVLLNKTKKVYLQEPIDDLDQALVYPVPVKPQHSKVTFAKLPENTQIHIFSLNGNHIRTIDEPTSFGGVHWDLKDDDAKNVSSGIYIYQIIHENNRKFGKLVIVR